MHRNNLLPEPQPQRHLKVRVHCFEFSHCSLHFQHLYLLFKLNGTGMAFFRSYNPSSKLKSSLSKQNNFHLNDTLLFSDHWLGLLVSISKR